MVRVRLGRSELMVSPICHGTWQLSPKFWGEQPREVMVAAARKAFELGVNFFDTADAYGDGLAEEVLGEALRPLPRDQVVVATKVYHYFHPDGHRYPDLSAEYIEQAFEASLKRLQMDYLDLYQCHSFDPLADLEETTGALERLKRMGKIRAYGGSNFTVEQLRTARSFGDYATLQPRYNLLQSSASRTTYWSSGSSRRTCLPSRSGSLGRVLRFQTSRPMYFSLFRMPVSWGR